MSSTKIINYKANSSPGQSSSTTLVTLTENIAEIFERRFYTINNSTRINLHTHDNDLFTCLQQLLIHGIELTFSLLVSGRRLYSH